METTSSPAPAPSPSGSSKTSPTKPSTPGYGNRGGDGDVKRDGTPGRDKKKVKMEAPVVQPGECPRGISEPRRVEDMEFDEMNSLNGGPCPSEALF